MDLILVRHGETDANREGRLMSGTGGPPLNAIGRAQADDLAAALRTELPFRLYTSPQKYPAYFGKWESDPASARPPGGETITELQDRAWRAVRRLSDAHAAETVVAVSHRFTILTVVAKALDTPLRHFRRVRLDLGAMVRIELSPGKSEVISTNETWHLRTPRHLP